MYELKTNTATRIAVGPLVDPTDGKTAETALTVTGLAVEIFQIKNDGSAVVRSAFAPTASGGNNDMVHITDDTTGMYDLELTAAQLNFLGNARIAFYDVDGFLVHWIDVLIVSAAYFDWKYGATVPDVNASKIGGTTQTGRDIGASVLVGDKTGFALTSAYDEAKSAAQAGDKMDIVNAPNNTALVALAAVVEAAIISEVDGKQVLKAITDKIASVNPDLGGLTVSAIASAVATALLITPANKISTDAANAVKIQKMAVTLAAADVSGNLPAVVKAQDDIDFTDTQKATYVSVFPARFSALNISADGSVVSALASGDIAAIAAAVWAATTRTLSGVGTLVADMAAAVWAAASRTLTTPGVVLPVMQGAVYMATAQQGVEVVIVQGDTPRMTFDFGDDYTGWVPYFGAKAALADTDYAIDPKAATWSDDALGQGYVDLTALETAFTGKYFSEIELRNGDQRLTAMKFKLKIIDAVIKET